MNKPNPTKNKLADHYARWLSSVWFALGFTWFLFVCKAPYMDLPVYDDGSTFYNGWRIINGDFGALNFQWSPLLTFICAGIQIVLPDHPIEGFFLFHLIGHTFIALGGFAMLRVFGVDARFAAPIAAAWCGLIHAMGVMMEFPTLHLYHTGLPLLIGAYLLQQTPISLSTGLGLSTLAFFLRNEAAIVLAILLIAGALRRRSLSIALWKRNIPASLAVWMAIGVSVFLMNGDERNWQAERMHQAFRQKFYVYALSSVQYDAVFPMTREAEFRIVENAFGDDASNMSVPQLFFRNPSAFIGFMNFNLQIIVNGELGYDGHHWLLSYSLTILYGIGCGVIGYAAVKRRQWWIALLLLTLLIKVPLLLITVPRVRYFGDALFVTMFCSWALAGFRRQKRLADVVASVLVSITMYSFLVLPSIKPLGVRPNMERALFVRKADPFLNFQNHSIAENYPTFSTAFGSRGFRESFSLDDSVYQFGDQLYGRDGRVCDYVLIEDGLPINAKISQWASTHSPLLSQGRFYLYSQVRPSSHDRTTRSIGQPVWTTDSYSSDNQTDGRIDPDEYPHPEVAIKWDFTQMGINNTELLSDVHLYVEVNGAKDLKPLGAPHQLDAPYFEWAPNSPIVHESMRSGPAFGAAYRFVVFTRLKGQEQFSQPWMTEKPVRFQPFLTVTDSRETRFDLSGGYDADDEDERSLVVRWDLPNQVRESYTIVDFHMYVRVNNDEQLQYLGQTLNGNADSIEWNSGSELIASEFRSGPTFGNDYEFMLYIIPEERAKTPKAPYRTLGPVKYVSDEYEPTSEVTTQLESYEVTIDWAIDLNRLKQFPVYGFDVYVHELRTNEIYFINRSDSQSPGKFGFSPGEYQLAAYPLWIEQRPEGVNFAISDVLVIQ